MASTRPERRRHGHRDWRWPLVALAGAGESTKVNSWSSPSGSLSCCPLRIVGAAAVRARGPSSVIAPLAALRRPEHGLMVEEVALEVSVAATAPPALIDTDRRGKGRSVVDVGLRIGVVAVKAVCCGSVIWRVQRKPPGCPKARNTCN